MGALAGGQACWPTLRSVFEQMRRDAKHNGFYKCLLIDDRAQAVTVVLTGNEGYFQGE